MKKKHGFATWDKAKVVEAARKGGLSVPSEKRLFKDKDKARAAGLKGAKTRWGDKDAK